jgi:hypothetical protein
MPTRKPVKVPEAPKEVKPPEQPPEPPKPVEATPEARIEAARESQRKANREWAEKNQFKESEYHRLQKKFPDLIPPGPIQERIKQYAIGDEKVKAIAALGPKYSRMEEALEAERMAHNQKLLELFRKKSDIQIQYIGTKKPIPPKVASEMLKLQDEIDKYAALRDGIKSKVNLLASERRKEAHQYLRVKDHADFYTVDPDQSDWQEREYTKLQGTTKERLDESLRWLEAHIARGDRSTVEVVVGSSTSNGRAHYKHRETFKPLMNAPEGTSVKTFIHEFGHAIDYQFITGDKVPGQPLKAVLRKSREFLEYRVGDEPSVGMNEVPGSPGGYDQNERGRKDKFDEVHEGSSAYYAGHTTSVEVFTMGFQEMWDNPVKLATKDPEWAKYIMGIMDGSLR